MRFVFLALLLGPVPAAAEPHPSQPSETRVGIGIPVEMLLSLGYLGYIEPDVERMDSLLDHRSVRVPVLLSSGLRIEPEVGLASLKYDGDVSSMTRLSVAVTPSWEVGNNLSGYGGGRVGVLQLKEENADNQTVTDLHIGGLVGGEYWFGRSFSLGGEASLTYTRFDDESFYGDQEEMSTVALGSTLLLRFYLK
jgi:hypothetical protein